jgi:hypothetical protein
MRELNRKANGLESKAQKLDEKATRLLGDRRNALPSAEVVSVEDSEIKASLKSYKISAGNREIKKPLTL